MLGDGCRFGHPIFEMEIEQRIAYAEATTMGKTVFEWAGAGHAAFEIQKLAHELLEVLVAQNIHPSAETKAVGA